MTTSTSLNNCALVRAAAIERRQRIDGRGLLDVRDVAVEYGEEWGHVQVQWGETLVLVQVVAEIVVPYSDHPTEGFFNINVELSPMASPSFESGRPSDEGVQLQRILERTFKDSRAIDTEALCIVASEKVWNISVMVHVLNDGGNLIDSATFGTSAALLYFRRPAVSVIGNEATVHSERDREAVPLGIHHLPVAITFAFFLPPNAQEQEVETGQRDLVTMIDPSRHEEPVVDTGLTFAVNAHRELCMTHKHGGIALELEEILLCGRLAAEKAQKLSTIIKDTCKERVTQRTGTKERIPGLGEDKPNAKQTSAPKPAPKIITRMEQDKTTVEKKETKLPASTRRAQVNAESDHDSSSDEEEETAMLTL